MASLLYRDSRGRYSVRPFYGGEKEIEIRRMRRELLTSPSTKIPIELYQRTIDSKRILPGDLPRVPILQPSTRPSLARSFVF